MDDSRPSRCDVATRRGASDAVVWSLADADGVADDLTGVAAESHARFGTPDAPGGIALALGPASHAVRGPEGEVERSLTPAQTLALPAGDYFYELVLTYPGGWVSIPAWGYWTHLTSGLADGGA